VVGANFFISLLIIVVGYTGGRVFEERLLLEFRGEAQAVPQGMSSKINFCFVFLWPDQIVISAWTRS
jgi:hypothetical protein